MSITWALTRSAFVRKPWAGWWMAMAIPVALGNPQAASAEASAAPVKVRVFTDSRRFSIRHTDSSDVSVTVYDLAAPKRAIADLNATLKLPANPEQAAAIAKAYLQSHQAEMAGRILPTYAGLSKAIQLGVSHYPAFVFNDKEVIYGVTDIQEGLRLYQNWHQGDASP